MIPADNWQCKHQGGCKELQCRDGCKLKPCRKCGENRELCPARLICRVCFYKQQKQYRANNQPDNDYFQRWRETHRLSLREYNREYMRARRLKNETLDR